MNFQHKIAEKLGVKPQSVDYLVKNKETIKRKIEAGGFSGLEKSLKSVQDAELQELDNLLLEWVTLQRKLGKEIHGAIMLAAPHTIQRRNNSVLVRNSWVHRFRERHNIKWAVLRGEGASCPDVVE